ncbi:unnamed protein product [Blepharisma stoltei]|uniref:Kinesin-like protein n=1 Tax=Blepharisma stoltei TaxID=1481888 RepID=A0AAU9JDU7_9CILI|nr:unnamed protein product [Blepharisma stoltei]
MEQSEDLTSGNIKVVCRFRPLNEKEKQLSEGICVDFLPDHKTTMMKSHPEGQEPPRFTLDYVFTPQARQSEVYEIAAKQIIAAVMQGFNGTVFAYGQTSSGKTFTMSGPSMEDPELMGIIPRMVGDVFSKIDSAAEHLEFTVKVGYCEIYMEKIKDLLDPTKNNLKIHEDRTRGVFIEGLTEKYAATEEDVYDMMAIGIENREVGYTNMNAGSSRSHSIFIVTITQTNSIDYSTKVGKLYLVDLAGSEKVGKTGAEGKRLEEAKNINKSLTVLGQVINSLTDGKSTHIPYRDSKLTRVLQDSLGGNSKTSLIITCSPSPYNEAETLSTLRFGMRAKSIKNKPKVNREYTVAELKLMLAKANDEIRLKESRIRQLETTIGQSGLAVPKDLEEMKDSSFIEEDSKATEYDEVIQELEEVRSQLNREVELRTQTAQELVKKSLEFEELKISYETLINENSVLEEKYAKKKAEFNETQEKANKLELSQIMIKNEFNDLNKRVLDLEQLLNSRDVEIDHLKAQQTPNTLNEPGEDYSELLDEFKNQLQIEQKKNKDLNDHIELLHKQIEEQQQKLTTQKPGLPFTASRAPDSWEEEKKLLLRDLQNRVEKVVNLQIALDDFRDRYHSLENSLPRGAKEFKNKADALERTVDQLTNANHDLIHQKSDLKVEIQMQEKKNASIMERNNKLEAELKRYKALLAEAESTMKNWYAEMEGRRSLRPSLGGGYSNIIKTIRGGGGAARMSTMPGKLQNPFEKNL